jgi:hypothetical protein
MRRGFIYVEGQTEETFVREVLAPDLASRLNMSLTPVLAKTKRPQAGPTFKGGISSYSQVKKEIRQLLRDSNVVLVTTMIDYYGLPNDFPGKDTLPAGTPYDRVRHLEDAFKNDIEDPRFLPFLVLHEFEALVLAGLDHLPSILPGCDKQVSQLIHDIEGLSPEEINEGSATHPSARIRQHLPGYQKCLHGPRVVQKLGVATLRQKCPHFAEWLSRVESV